MKRIAILGLGAMGFRMAQALLSAGYPVVVYNRTFEKAQPLLKQGAVYADTPRTAAAQADVVISMVTDDTASRSVWLRSDTGAVMGLQRQTVAISSSTLTLDWTKELAAAIKQRGATFLDAPVVGSRPQAEAGKLIYVVGGESKTLMQVQEILAVSGNAIHHVGTTGQGMAMKLAVNALFGIQIVALAEILMMLNRYGIMPEPAMECLHELPVTSLAAKGAGNLMAAKQHAPLFPIELVEKDFRYALEMAEKAGIVSLSMRAVHKVYEEAIAQGYGGDNITGVIQLFEAQR